MMLQFVFSGSNNHHRHLNNTSSNLHVHLQRGSIPSTSALL
jgi:hypothetical protein